MSDLLAAAIERQRLGNLVGAAQLYQRLRTADRRVLARQATDGQWVQAPDFLIIGAARCGTTWLKKRLSGLSAIRIQPGEPNYFSFRIHEDPREYLAALTTAAKNLNLPHDGSPRLYGEKSPSYLLMPDDKIGLVRALFPDVKIIVMVRDPIDRAWSHIRARTEDYRSLPDLRHLLRDGRYLEHLSRWARHFPPDQIQIISYDDVCERPRDALGDVLAFLGLTGGSPNTTYPAPPKIPPMPSELRSQLELECAGDVWDVDVLRDTIAQIEQKRVAPLAGPPLSEVHGFGTPRLEARSLTEPTMR